MPDLDKSRKGLLSLANFPANTGYAWDFIESLYAGVADRLRDEGIDTWVGYPRIDSEPRSLQGSAARWVELAIDFSRAGSVMNACRFIRRHRIHGLYLADRPSWSIAYAAFRLAGVRWIVVHDHTSGERTPPSGLRRGLKRCARLLPGTVADRVVAVSDYVANRKIEVDLVSPKIVRRIWNGVPPRSGSDPEAARQTLFQFAGLEEDDGSPVLVALGRAVRAKGFHYLFRGFDDALDRMKAAKRPRLFYLGDGPYFNELQRLRGNLRHGDRVEMLGYVSNASGLLAGADLCVFPSVWGEAFGLGALEPMSMGVPVIATRVGGIPEVVVDGDTGLVVPPRHVGAIAAAIVYLLADRERLEEMGARGRDRTLALFSLDDRIDEIAEIVFSGFASTTESGMLAGGS